MEEILYILPFARYGEVFIVTLIIAFIILLAIMLRLLKIPQKLMAILITATAMMFLLFYQSEGLARLSPLIDVPKRQKQLDQQLSTNPLPLDGADLRYIAVRFNSLTLDFHVPQATYKTMHYDNLAAYAQNFGIKNKERLCTILKLEQESSYRQHDLLFNLTLRKLSLNFTSENEHYSLNYTSENFDCF